MRVFHLVQIYLKQQQQNIAEFVCPREIDQTSSVHL